MIAFREFSAKLVLLLPPREHIPHWNAKVCRIPKLNQRIWNLSCLFRYSGPWRNVLRLFGVFLTLLWSRYIHMCRRSVHLYLFREFYSFIIREKIASGVDVPLQNGREKLSSRTSRIMTVAGKKAPKETNDLRVSRMMFDGRTHKTQYIGFLSFFSCAFGELFLALPRPQRGRSAHFALVEFDCLVLVRRCLSSQIVNQ